MDNDIKMVLDRFCEYIHKMIFIKNNEVIVRLIKLFDELNNETKCFCAHDNKIKYMTAKHRNKILIKKVLKKLEKKLKEGNND